MDLILASTSPYRRALVERLGVPFRCVDPGVDERLIERELVGATPRMIAEALARAKAEAVAASEPDAVVIGSDQLVSFEGEILGKPGTVEAAIKQLRRMSGRSHDLITAVQVIQGGKAQAHTDLTTLRFRLMTPDQIRRYVEQDHPLDCAGGYKLESRGIALFERIDSADHSAIVGIPLIALTSMLISLGFEIP
jgi:septum formation protein